MLQHPCAMGTYVFGSIQLYPMFSHALNLRSYEYVTSFLHFSVNFFLFLIKNVWVIGIEISKFVLKLAAGLKKRLILFDLLLTWVAFICSMLLLV